MKKLKITEQDYLKAHRRASRAEELAIRQTVAHVENPQIEKGLRPQTAKGRT